MRVEQRSDHLEAAEVGVAGRRRQASDVWTPRPAGHPAPRSNGGRLPPEEAGAVRLARAGRHPATARRAAVGAEREAGTALLVVVVVVGPS